MIRLAVARNIKSAMGRERQAIKKARSGAF